MSNLTYIESPKQHDTLFNPPEVVLIQSILYIQHLLSFADIA